MCSGNHAHHGDTIESNASKDWILFIADIVQLLVVIGLLTWFVVSMIWSTPQSKPAPKAEVPPAVASDTTTVGEYSVTLHDVPLHKALVMVSELTNGVVQVRIQNGVDTMIPVSLSVSDKSLNALAAELAKRAGVRYSLSDAFLDIYQDTSSIGLERIKS